MKEQKTKKTGKVGSENRKEGVEEAEEKVQSTLDAVARAAYCKPGPAAATVFAVKFYWIERKEEERKEKGKFLHLLIPSSSSANSDCTYDQNAKRRNDVQKQKAKKE